ncbi:MAG: potassium transporter TrkG [Balneolaceae bacterium]|nr:potassium transporter TrkG [Balneolaceae bacterium]
MNYLRRWKRLKIRLSVKGRQLYKKVRLQFKDIEIELYDLNTSLKPWFRGISIILVVLAVGSLVGSIGFELTPEYRYWNEILDLAIVGGFILVFAGRLVFTSRRRALIQNRLVESTLFLLLVLFLGFFSLGEFIPQDLYLLFPYMTGGYDLLVLVTKLYLVVIVFVKLLRATPLLISLQRHPTQVIAGSFLAVIVVGCLLLMLPNTTVNGEGLSFINALFTSTSAVCVTGLIVVDTATHFTFMGQVIILLLIQVGGIGIITFATLFALYISSGLGVGQMTFLKDIVSTDQAHETVATIKRIVGMTLILEILGAAAYYISWSQLLPDTGNRLWFSLFHAVSAFCNAGFSLFSDSLAAPANMLNWGVNITTMSLVIIGGLGFTTLWELIRGNPRKKNPYQRYSMHTRFVLYATAVLVISGTVGFLVLEWSNSLGSYGLPDKLMISAFQSITTRTAGFNTVDIGGLTTSTTVMFLTLMAIGASPASTGGGIKTTTIMVMLLAVWANITGRERVEFNKRTIPYRTVFTALTAFTLAAVGLFIFTFLLTITENMPFIDLLFEEFSAFATVGLSRGVTSALSDWGKLIVASSMFIGRVGSVTLAVAFARREKPRKYRYPEESVIVA